MTKKLKDKTYPGEKDPKEGLVYADPDEWGDIT